MSLTGVSARTTSSLPSMTRSFLMRLAQLVRPRFHRDLEDVLPHLALEPGLLLAEANRVGRHSLKDARQTLVVELHLEGVDDALTHIDVVVSEPVEVFVPTRTGCPWDAIHLMVHLTVRLRGGRAREEDDVAATDEVAHVLGPLAGLGEGPQPMGLIQDDEVPVLVGQLVHALVVDGEELVRGAQLHGVLTYAMQRLLLGQEQDAAMHAHLLRDTQRRERLAGAHLHSEVYETVLLEDALGTVYDALLVASQFHVISVCSSSSCFCRMRSQRPRWSRPSSGGTP